MSWTKYIFGYFWLFLAIFNILSLNKFESQIIIGIVRDISQLFKVFCNIQFLGFWKHSNFWANLNKKRTVTGVDLTQHVISVHNNTIMY